MSALRCSASFLELRIVLQQAMAIGKVKKIRTVEYGSTLANVKPTTHRYEKAISIEYIIAEIFLRLSFFFVLLA